MKDAQKDLADEITPQISELLKRAEQSLAKLERKQFALKSKVLSKDGVKLIKADLQSVRLSQKPTRLARPASAEDDKTLREKWKVVHGRRERLNYTAERLALEIEQKVTCFCRHD